METETVSPEGKAILQEIFDLAVEAFLQPDSLPSTALDDTGNPVCVYEGADGRNCAIGLYLKKHLSTEVFQQIVKEHNAEMVDNLAYFVPEVASLFAPFVDIWTDGIDPLKTIQWELHDNLREGLKAEWHAGYATPRQRAEAYFIVARHYGLEFDASKYLPSVV